MIERQWCLTRHAFADTPDPDCVRGKLALVEAIGCRLRKLHRNVRRPALVVNEAQRGDLPRSNTLAALPLFVGAIRSIHQIDAELVGDVADDQ